MMFDMNLSFSFGSLKEAERQLMSALAEIFAKKVILKAGFRLGLRLKSKM